MATDTLPTRSELDPQFTWDLQSLYPHEGAYSEDLEAVLQEIAALEGYRGRLGDDAAMLLAFLERFWRTFTRLERLQLYAMLPVAADQFDQRARERAGRFRSVVARWSKATSFIEPELLALGEERLSGLVEREPGLEGYRRYFERLEKGRPHVRSPEVEELLGALADPFSATEGAYNSLANGELPFAPVEHDGRTFEVARSTMPQLRNSPDRELRRKAFISYSDGFLAFRNTFTDLYVGELKRSVFEANARGYDSTVALQLEPREVPRAVLDAVVDTFRANLPVWHRYWAARRRVLGVERLEPWDIFAPLSPAAPRVPYAQAVEWALEGLAPLGEEYLGPLERGLRAQRWVDVYPNRGKRDGAFAASAYGRQPFILMSYHDDLESVSTLAHELGHAMHNVLMNEVQPPVYTNYSMTVAETASNFNQALVRAHLLERLQSPEEQLAVLDEAFYNFHRYFFIMPTLVRFELEAHAAAERGEGLTADRLIETMRGLFAEGYGDEIDADERTGITWAQFGHLYEPFYTFQYAAGISAAAALSGPVLRGDGDAAERYLAFLRAGSSLPPIEALRLAGVDLTTSEPIEQAFAILEGYVERLEELAR